MRANRWPAGWRRCGDAGPHLAGGRRGRAAARWRAGPDSQGASATVSQGRELQRNDKVSFLSTPFLIPLFPPCEESTLQRWRQAPERTQPKILFFSSPLGFFFAVATQETQSRSGGEVAMERRLHPSTYVEFGNYGLAVNSGEQRRQQQFPPPEEKSGRGKRKNCHGSHA